MTEPVDRALDILRGGGVVAIPTETVYGLAADASNEAAVRRIFEIKRRPADHPLIVHIASAAGLEQWAASVSRDAALLADDCWPGPLTLLLPRAASVLNVVTGGRSSVGLRVPAHPLTLELLTRFGGGLAAPSANRYGKVSPTTAAHVHDDLGPDVDFILDGGACPIGVESTIVDCTVSPPQILRPGGIPNEVIAALLEETPGETSGPRRASGMLASHYAPVCRVEIFDDPDEARLHVKELRVTGQRVELLDATVDLVDTARHLYERLRDADRRNVDEVVAILPPPTGLGHAIRDRLTKAAGLG